MLTFVPGIMGPRLLFRLEARQLTGRVVRIWVKPGLEVVAEGLEGEPAGVVPWVAAGEPTEGVERGAAEGGEPGDAEGAGAGKPAGGTTGGAGAGKPAGGTPGGAGAGEPAGGTPGAAGAGEPAGGTAGGSIVKKPARPYTPPSVGGESLIPFPQSLELPVCKRI